MNGLIYIRTFILFILGIAATATTYAQTQVLKADSLQLVQLFEEVRTTHKDSLKKIVALNRQTLVLAKRLGHLPSLARSYRMNGYSEYKSGNSEVCYTYIDSSFYYYALLRDTPSMEYVLYLKGGMLYKHAKYTEAEATFQQATALLYQYSQKDSLLLAWRHNALGVLNKKLAKPELAISHFQQALIYFKGNKSQIPGVLSNIKNLYLDMGVLDSALIYGYQSLDLLEQGKDDDGIIFLLAELSNIYQRIGNKKKAGETIKRALSLSKKKNIQRHDYKIYRRMGNFFEMEYQDLDSALYYHKLALKNIPKVDTTALLNTWIDLSECFLHLNIPDSVFLYVGHVLKHKNNNKKARYYHIYATQILSKLMLLKGETKSAWLLADSALQMCQHGSFTSLLPETYLQLSKVHESNANLDKSLFYYKKYAAVKDSIFHANVYITEQSIKDQKLIKEKQLALEKQYTQLKRKNNLVTLLWIGLILLVFSFTYLYWYNRNHFIRKINRLQKLIPQKLSALDSLEQAIITADLASQSNEALHKTSQLKNTLRQLQYVNHTYKESVSKSKGFNAIKKNNTHEQIALYNHLIVHDIKNYLLKIKSQVQPNQTNVQHTLLELEGFLQKAAELSKLESIKLEIIPIDIPLLIEDILKTMGTSWTAQGLSVHVAPNFPPVEGDVFLVRQLCTNLLDNAVKYTQLGKSPHVHISFQHTAEEDFVLSFKDNGAGISESTDIFEPYQQIDHQSMGQGLGLAIVKKIVELHAGSIWFESELGRGTTFYFSLPQTDS